jgi:hypothetical protein
MPLADRFSEYVAELHELNDSHRLPHGKPEDLSRLMKAFQKSQSFAADFGCVMRSIVLREHFRASETELLTLVVVAWAGAELDDSTPQFSRLIQELRGILQKALAHRVLAHRTDGPITISTEDPEEVRDVSADLSDTTRKPEEVNPDVPISRQSPNVQDSHEKRHTTVEDSVSIQRSVPAQDSRPSSSGGAPQEPEQVLSIQKLSFHEAPERDLTGREDKSKSLDYLLTYSSGTKNQTIPPRRLEPSVAEVLAMGLTGLMVALLFSAGYLPVYRARVSVDLPSTIASTTNPGANINGPSSGSRELSLLNGELTEKVAERLLAQPHKPILRQDVLSRGMRDLHLGGNETILYADLVAETARQVKVAHLQPQNLYAITCDSWNAQFAATFCNELTDSLNDQPSDAISAPGPARTIDAALGPGTQIYPHWYLLGSLGLAVGCLAGVLLGFVQRPVPQPIQQTDLEA